MPAKSPLAQIAPHLTGATLMPSRVIHGESVWASGKIAACKTEIPATSGVYYPWFYTLADANGSFEITSLRVIHAKVASQLEFLTIDHVAAILEDFKREGLLFTWEENKKVFAHWTNSDQPGRLPPPSHRQRYECFAPVVPSDQLNTYMQGFSGALSRFKRKETHALPTSGVNPDNIRSQSGQHPESIRTTSGVNPDPRPDNIRNGVGVGVGVGVGEGKSSIVHQSVHQKPMDERERRTNFEIFWDAYPRKEKRPKAKIAFEGIIGLNGHFADLLSALEVWKKSEQWQTDRFIPLPHNWIADRQWQDRPAPPAGNLQEPKWKRDTAEREKRQMESIARLNKKS